MPDLTRDEIEGLAAGLSAFDQKVERIAANTNLSPAGATAALALLVSINRGLFAKSATALRTLLQEQSNG